MLRIENHGAIRGVTADGRDASANTRDALFVTHTGLITGWTLAIQWTSLGDTIINSGVFTTRVDLDLGNDLYDGRLSYAESDILGEAGNGVLSGGVIDDSPYGANNDD